MKKPLISFKDFTFQYHSQSEPTLHDINLTIYEGEKILVVGPSGSGKSTFAKCINGLIPTIYEGDIKGNVTIAGKNLTQTKLVDLSYEVGTVLQDTDGQFIGLSVAEDIAFALENDCVTLEKMHQDVQRWAEMVELENFLTHRPQDLSGGQKQRVCIAGVLIDEAPILLFDEPLANLDPAAGKETIALIDQLHRQTNTTMIIIEHRLEDVLFRPVDRIVVFDEGSIVADMKPEELLKTGILSHYGIREPLYITAMKYANVDLDTISVIERLEKIQGKTLKSKMEHWMKNQVFEKPEKKQQPLLEVEQVSYAYYLKEKKILNNISVSFNEGEMISIVGKNGAGKSTLIKAICGFITPESGAIRWKSESMKKWSIKERADKIGYVMQNPNQMISQKLVIDEVALGLVLKGVSKKEIDEKVEKVLKVCGLYPFRNWPISALSFGQKKRVTIASILVLEPELILLDEPTAGQDFKHYTEMMSFLETLNQQGITIVMITHDMHLMLEYTNRAIVVFDGEILADTSPVKLLTDQNLVQKASLKETSLFKFAQKIGLEDPLAFTETFISYDRQVR